MVGCFRFRVIACVKLKLNVRICPELRR
jgi:hypothetical protein